MSQAVRCWRPENGEDESDATTVEAYDSRTAAEVFIEDNWEAVDGQTFYEVMTRDPFGVERLFEVRVVPEPTFVASEVRRPSPNRGEGGDRG